MTPLIALALGTCAGVGSVIALAGLRGIRLLPDLSVRVSTGRGEKLGLACAAVLIGALVWASTGWVVAAGLIAGLTVGYPLVSQSRGNRRRQVERVEAVAVWAEMIRDNIAGSAGLEQALIAASQVAPRPIATELRRFGGRLDHMGLVEALGLLGEDLDNPSADLVIVALVTATRMEARQLGPLLGRLAETARADVRMRQRVDVGRARIHTSARIVVATTVATVVFLVWFSPNLVAAYDSTPGQLWLLLVAGVFAAGIWLLHVFGQIEMPDRFAARAGTDGVVQ